MDELINRIGHEVPVEEVSRTLCRVAGELRPGVVGAMQLTCADESENECVQAFEREFVRPLLPPLKHAHRAAFRISNLGGRYDRGAVGLVEDHFRLPGGPSAFKLIVAKVNAHVGVTVENGIEHYGTLMRYGVPSTCCGALSAVMAGKRASNLDEIRDLFRSGGADRLAVLMDAEKVAPQYRSLYVAVLSAGLQARRVVTDAREHAPADPTLYLVVPCVTLNRPGPDTEILCGVYTADYRSAETREEYTGLEDDPSAYSFHIRNRQIYINDNSKNIV